MPFFVFAQAAELPSPPKIFDETREIAEKALKGVIESLARIWKEKILPKQFFQKIGQKIQVIFKKETEKRKEIIEKEFQKEKEELKKEIKEKIIPKNTKSLWEKFKELIR